jgi:transcriptional regulator with XRE-family HTH domain
VAKIPAEEYAEILGTVFKEERLRVGMSQKQLAEASTVGRTGIINFEAGKRNISILLGHMLAEGMKTSYSSLIEEAEQRWQKRKK